MTERKSPTDRQSLLSEADQLMEEALALLDGAQAYLPAAKLDEALSTLRLRTNTNGS
ncbi:hypothetical protein SAMN02745824_1118 [Parasphingorhabdus marina DSM 22363]|uniref:Uncharacterized protein n=1 Tax=Parasphingorhabdus marina DSM 22363 TaxID=1123272 RepID=A0A1N6CVX7_9SPHN|nr:hypothetical protein [Parasphingorhabdus marina]SIN62711.1 hypothetical protein SAMN02745824_1118 [Parasphingorhabdus marina DSM 22363]